MSSFAELDQSNVVDIDLGSAEFKANAHRHMVEWARRPPFYVLGHGQPQVVVGRYVDVHKVFSDTQTFASYSASAARRCRPPAALPAVRCTCFTRTTTSGTN